MSTIMELNRKLKSGESISKQEAVDAITNEINVVVENFELIGSSPGRIELNQFETIQMLDAYYSSDQLFFGERFNANIYEALNNNNNISRDDAKVLMKALYREKFITIPQFFRGDLENSVNIDIYGFENTMDYLYSTYPNIFDSNTSYFMNNETFAILREFDNYYRDLDESEANYKIFLEYGSIIDIICDENCITKITNKGIVLLSEQMYVKSKKLLIEMDEMKGNYEKTKEELEELQSLNDDMEGKINNFYGNIVTILSLLIGAFAILGINITSIPNIEKQFFLNILIINGTIMLAIAFLFLVLKVTVFNHTRIIDNEEFKKVRKYFNKLWIVIFCVPVLLILIAVISLIIYL